MSEQRSIGSLWYTRCPVPSATGIAIARRAFEAEYAADGINVEPITNAPSASHESHFNHGLSALFREGGNVPAIAAKASGSRTTLLGLTFVPEFQAIAVLPDSPINSVDDLTGRRLLVPDHGIDRVDFFRAMSMRGFANALASIDATLDDCELVSVRRPPAQLGDPKSDGYDWEVEALQAGLGDAISIKGALGADLVLKGVVRPIHRIEMAGALGNQINNGTPRTITVSTELVDARPDIAERYLLTLLRSALWGREHISDVVDIVSNEIGASPEGVKYAYGPEMTAHVTPSLQQNLVECLALQKRFLLDHGFIKDDFELRDWIAPEPLRRATELFEAEQAGH